MNWRSSSLERVESNFGSALTQLETRLNSNLNSSISQLSLNIARVENDLNAAIERFDHKMLQMEYRITIKLGAMMTIAVGVLAANIKLI